VPAVLGGLVLVLLIAAFGLGKVFSGLMAGNDTSSASESTLVSGTGHGRQPKGPIYNGATKAASISAASASCQAPNAVDAARNPVSYSPSNVFDGDITTAWRCNGDGAGQRLVLSLPAQTRLGSLGLVPGYAKTDPTSGADRYAENDRITAVRWSFGNGTSVTQHFNGSARDRRMQSIRIPPVNTSKVVVHILSSTPGPRHTIAVSEVQLGKVAG
jgi:hypothetical protein